MRKILTTIMTVFIAAIFTSCSMVTDDIDHCPKGLYVRFVYDYNIERADMFKDHVGHVTLYLYDEDGRLVTTRSVSNTETSKPLAVYGYSMHFEPSELKPGRYRLVAVGMQRDWDDAIQDKGAKVRRPDSHTHSSELILSLDHTDTPDAVSGAHRVEHYDVPLDTLWHTLKVMSFEPVDGVAVPAPQKTTAPYSIYPLEDQYVTVTDDRATYATVSMIRDTKHINITMHQIEDKANMYADDYEVSILDANCTLDHDNTVLREHRLHYSPYASWTSRFDSGGTVIETGTGVSRAGADEDPDTERTAHYNLMTNRMIHYGADSDTNGRLRITNKKNGSIVADINLPSMLQEGRIAYAINNYSAQEYLDREHDYHLQLFLKGDTWLYASITVNVLGWSHRIDNREL